jgi:hypothetical protein
MRYKQIETFDEMVEVAKKKEESTKEVPLPTIQSMAKKV